MADGFFPGALDHDSRNAKTDRGRSAEAEKRKPHGSPPNWYGFIWYRSFG
jgi:hypothetical protein